MSILAAKLADLNDRIRVSDQVDAGLRSELQTVCHLAGGLDPYVDRCTTPESPALRLIAERTQAENWDRGPGAGPGPLLEQEMLSGHVEGQVLNFLVHLTGATRVLEIGMFTGYSAMAMAEALPETGVVVACEVDPYVAAFAQRCFDESPSGGKIVVKVGPGLCSLRELSDAGDVFDLVFIDADKGGYAGYLDLLLDSGLLAPRAVICVDNTLMQGLPYGAGGTTPNGEAIAAFNAAVADDRRVVQVLLPVRDGLTLIRRA